MCAYRIDLIDIGNVQQMQHKINNASSLLLYFLLLLPLSILIPLLLLLFLVTFIKFVITFSYNFFHYFFICDLMICAHEFQHKPKQK